MEGTGIAYHHLGLLIMVVTWRALVSLTITWVC